jgi:SAM-dependent methyltransferase
MGAYPRAPLYDPNNLHSEGTLRGMALADLLQQHGVSLTTGSLLDLGCGFGGLSIHAARCGAAVTAIDASDHKLKVLEARIADEQWPPGAGVTALKANATNLPLETGVFDTAVTLGVIEWVPLTADGEPRAVQLRALREIARVLKPGGTYILATKNRWFPNYLVREAQSGRPLLNHLPRSVAQRVSCAIYGEPYRTYVHSLAGWRSMLSEAGFASVQAMLPLYYYQFPLDLWSITDGLLDRIHPRAHADWLTDDYKREAEKGSLMFKKVFAKLAVGTNLTWLFWPAFVFVARTQV